MSTTVRCGACGNPAHPGGMQDCPVISARPQSPESRLRALLAEHPYASGITTSTDDLRAVLAELDALRVAEHTPEETP